VVGSRERGVIMGSNKAKKRGYQLNVRRHTKRHRERKTVIVQAVNLKEGVEGNARKTKEDYCWTKKRKEKRE